MVSQLYGSAFFLTLPLWILVCCALDSLPPFLPLQLPLPARHTPCTAHTPHLTTLTYLTYTYTCLHPLTSHCTLRTFVRDTPLQRTRCTAFALCHAHLRAAPHAALTLRALNNQTRAALTDSTYMDAGGILRRHGPKTHCDGMTKREKAKCTHRGWKNYLISVSNVCLLIAYIISSHVATMSYNLPYVYITSLP